MDYAKVLALLLSYQATQRALTVAALAEVLRTSARNVDYLILRHGFPKPFYLPRDRQRYWRPEDCIAWVRQRQQLEVDAIDIEGVCELTGLTAFRWRTLVRRKEAPACVAHALGTGRQLWLRAEVLAWRQRTAGGYKFPHQSRKKRRANGAPPSSSPPGSSSCAAAAMDMP